MGDDVHGSLKYALEHLGDSLKLIVVLGHSAVRSRHRGCRRLPRSGRLPVADGTPLDPQARRPVAGGRGRVGPSPGDAFGEDVAREPGYREALIEVAVISNAALGAHTLLRETVDETTQSVEVAYGVYLLDKRFVWAPRAGSDEVIGLATPPEDGPAFAEFSMAVMQSDRIRAILGRPPHVARNSPRK